MISTVKRKFLRFSSSRFKNDRDTVEQKRRNKEYKELKYHFFLKDGGRAAFSSYLGSHYPFNGCWRSVEMEVEA